MTSYLLRELAASDATSREASFEAAFGRERAASEWEWAYERNPAGTRVWVAEHEGRVVAHYAAWPLRVWLDGRERVFAQVVDSFVHPEHRAGLKRPGLFVATAREFFEHFGDRERDVAFFGWPLREAWRIGRRFLEYELVRPQLALVAPLQRPRAVAASVTPIEHFDERAKWLWDRCADELGISAIRDAAFLNWRLLDRPRGACRVLGVFDERAMLRGYVALRDAKHLLPGATAIVDWLVPTAEPEVADELLAAAHADAHAAGSSSLISFVPETSVWFPRFQARGFEVHPTSYSLVARSFSPRLDALRLRDQWWYQLADSDLV